jgi:hypothetical protein
MQKIIECKKLFKSKLIIHLNINRVFKIDEVPMTKMWNEDSLKNPIAPRLKI